MIQFSIRARNAMPRHRRNPERGKPPAFSLIELLLVMTIMIILISLAMPAMRGLLGGYNLTGSADNLVAQFSVARQTALGRNLPVEFRIYNTGTDAAPVWKTTALVVPAAVSGKTLDEWVSPASALSGSVTIDPGHSPKSGEPWSTLLVPATDPNAAAPLAGQEPDSAPATVRKLKYIAFRFLADGSTNLPAQDSSNKRQPWNLCLRNTDSAPLTDGTGPAKNYAALVVDPATSRILTFRP